MGTPIPFGPSDADPKLWAELVLQGRIVPGWALVEPERELKVDVKKAKGSSGAKVDFQGVEPANVSIKVRFLTAEDYDGIVNDILPMVLPDPSKKEPETLSISHPSVIAYRITAIIAKKVKGPVKLSDGTWELSIEAIEASPPQPKNSSGTFSGKASAKDTPCQRLSRQYDEQMALYGQKMSEAEARWKNSMKPAPKTETFIGGVDLSNGYNPESEKLQAQATQLRSEALAHKSVADTIMSQMAGLGCLEQKPGGKPATTQP